MDAIAEEGCPVPALLRRAAHNWPARVAVDFLGRRWRYSELDSLVDRAAAGLQKLGLAHGDRVGLCLPNTPYFVVFFFAIMRAGGIVVNFNPLYTERELRHQIEDSGTTIMIVPDLLAVHGKVAAVADAGLRHIVLCGMAAAMPRLKGALFTLAKRRDIARPSTDRLHVRFETLIGDVRAPVEPATDPARDIALLQYTGGTTGLPKGAALTHANLTVNAAQVIHHMGERPDEPERILGVLPLFHVFAMTSVLTSAVAIGAEMVLLPRFTMQDTLAAIARRRPTMFPAVPTIYNAISTAAATASPKVRDGLRAIRMCISGGAPLPAEVKAHFEALTGCKVAEGYGLSETSPVVCCNRLDGTAVAGSVGQAVRGTTIEIRDLDDPTRMLPAGERGEVCIRGPQVMAGYWNRPDETAAVMIDGALRTGDVGYLDAKGYLFLVDRIKDLILCGGYNVYPRTIEEALYRHPDVHEATVIGVPDAYRGESPKAFVVLHPGATADVAALRRFLDGELSRIEMPRDIELRDSLPHTTIGKLSKKELVAEEAARTRHAA
ncbi:long-chain-fatty-acid--CoA ligase [Lichenicoccus sp.]|uniref:long-chain-fatty-acid--CoA ligase n=1 Tax=Lichenicoccus sp. TaxID=2781899 RepID=UPI003D112708